MACFEQVLGGEAESQNAMGSHQLRSIGSWSSKTATRWWRAQLFMEESTSFELRLPEWW